MFINASRWRRPGALTVVVVFIGLQVVTCGLPAQEPPSLPVVVGFLAYQVVCILRR